MSNARKDDNAASTWIGLSCVDGVTPVRVKINPSNGGAVVDSTTVISFTPTPEMALIRDENGVPLTRAVGDDGKIYPIFVNPTTGGVLIST